MVEFSGDCPMSSIPYADSAIVRCRHQTRLAESQCGYCSTAKNMDLNKIIGQDILTHISTLNRFMCSSYLTGNFGF